jgi:biotin carboxyl carrier protein
MHRAAPDLVDLELDGHRVRCGVHHAGDRVHVDSALGASTFRELPRFPEATREDPGGSLRSPLPGTVVRVSVEPGAEVAAGTALVALEAMKMEHTVRAPHGGRVAAVHVAAGDQVAAGAVLVTLEAEEHA